MSDQVRYRTFAAELVASDGRTIVGRCVPYGEVATVDDGRGAYQEMFQRGAFRGCVKAPSRVFLRFEHRESLPDVAGHAVELEERDDGLHGVFRALETGSGDQALALVRAGVLPGMSVGFIAHGPGKLLSDGITVRTHCTLDEVSLVRQAAYAGAAVLGVRNRSAPVDSLRPARMIGLDDRLRAVGIEIPERR